VKAYCKCSAVGRLWYRDVIIFIWEKASSLKYVDLNYAVKRRPVDLLRREIRVSREQALAAIDRLAPSDFNLLKTKRNLLYTRWAKSRYTGILYITVYLLLAHLVY
jgi:hypothetical protein